MWTDLCACLCLCVCSVRSSRHSELDSSVRPSGQVAASAARPIPQRQFCTSIDRSDIQPASTTSRDAAHAAPRYDVAKVATGGLPREFASGGLQKFEAGDRRPVTGAEGIGMIARLSDDDYQSPDSAYHSSHSSGNNTSWNGQQGPNGQVPHQWWSQVSGVPAYSRNHEKSPSCPVTQMSNVRMSSTKFYHQNSAGFNSRHGEDSASLQSATQYYQGSAVQPHEETSRSVFHTEPSNFHPATYAAGNQNSSYQEYESPRNNSSTYASPYYGWMRSDEDTRFQECSPGPPPLPATSPPRDLPTKLLSSGARSISSSDVERLTTPCTTASHREVFDVEPNRLLPPSNGRGMVGMKSSPDMVRLQSFPETAAYDAHSQREPRSSVSARRRSCENGVAIVTPDDDRLSPRVTTVDEENLRLYLDQFPKSQSQTSVLRRLSQEYFGGSRSRYGINPTGRVSLGSISSSVSTSGNDLSQPVVSEDVDSDSRYHHSESPQETARSNVSDDAGTNFVRARKTQMSLRKAFGIFDDFDVAESESSKHLPVLTEDDVPSPTVHNSSFGSAAVHKPKDGKGRRSSESEFIHQVGREWRNFDRQSEKPAVITSSAMQRSMSVGSAGQAMSVASHGQRLSTASDAQSSHSSSSGSTNGVRSFLDFSTGSSARSSEVLPPYAAAASYEPPRPAKSKSLPRDSVPPTDVLSPQHWLQHDVSERSEVNCAFPVFRSLFVRLCLSSASVTFCICCSVHSKQVLLLLFLYLFQSHFSLD